MKSTINALFKTECNIPVIPLMRTLNEIDEFKTTDMDATLDSLQDIVSEAAIKLEVRKSDILAELLAAYQLNEVEEGNHVSISDVSSKCQKLLGNPS